MLAAFTPIHVHFRPAAYLSRQACGWETGSRGSYRGIFSGTRVEPPRTVRSPSAGVAQVRYQQPERVVGG